MDSEGGLQNIPLDQNYLSGFMPNGQTMFQGPTAGSVSHSIDTRVLSPVSVASSSRRSPLLSNSGPGSAMDRVASQISATDSSGSSRPTRSLYPGSAELVPSNSQMSHQFPSGASDITDHTFVSLPDGAYISSSPQFMDSQERSELSYQVTNDTTHGYSTLSNGMVPGTHVAENRSTSMSMEQSFFQTPETFTIGSPQEIFPASVENQRDADLRNSSINGQGGEYLTHYGPPCVFGAFDTDSPHDFNATTPSPWQQPYQMGRTGSGHGFAPTSLLGSPRYVCSSSITQLRMKSDHSRPIRSVHSSHTIEDLTPRQQHFNPELSRQGLPEGSSPVSNASQENSVEAEKLHNTYRSDPLYKSATMGSDGLYHCPFEGKDANCNHKPDKLKCNYEYGSISHI